MGMEIPCVQTSSHPEQAMQAKAGIGSVNSKPSIFLVGPPNVGKRSILTRLVISESAELTGLTSEIACHDWTIDTKYYSADVCIWVARVGDKTINSAWTPSEHCEALVMVFDLSNASSFEALQEWVSEVNLQKFEILLCVGNKADRVPSHFAHAEYRQKLQRHGESSSDPHPEFWDYGIDRNEGSSLLCEDEGSWEEMRRSCIEWCTQSNIEYIEACAINEAFDKCMSIDGDLQGVDRIRSALTAHMWPGMTMKSQTKLSNAPLQRKNEGFSDDDSDYEIEYELLSTGSADFSDGMGDHWVTVSNGEQVVIPVAGKVECKNDTEREHGHVGIQELQEAGSSWQPNDLASQNPVSTVENDDKIELSSALTSLIAEQESKSRGTEHGVQNAETWDKNEHAFEELERLMSEMAHMRENMRLMPDSQRREMAGRLAMQMASVFADEENDDGSD